MDCETDILMNCVGIAFNGLCKTDVLINSVGINVSGLRETNMLVNVWVVSGICGMDVLIVGIAVSRL